MRDSESVTLPTDAAFTAEGASRIDARGLDLWASRVKATAPPSTQACAKPREPAIATVTVTLTRGGDGCLVATFDVE